MINHRLMMFNDDGRDYGEINSSRTHIRDTRTHYNMQLTCLAVSTLCRFINLLIIIIIIIIIVSEVKNVQSGEH